MDYHRCAYECITFPGDLLGRRRLEKSPPRTKNGSFYVVVGTNVVLLQCLRKDTFQVYVVGHERWMALCAEVGRGLGAAMNLFVIAQSHIVRLMSYR